jgi:hypothetical protein
LCSVALARRASMALYYHSGRYAVAEGKAKLNY